MNKPQTDNPTPDNPVSVAKKPVWQRRAWLLLLVLLCLSGACAPVPKTWRAEAQIMVLSPAPAAPGDLLGVTPPQADESMETQIALIQNREMARRTIAQLKNAALIEHRQNDVTFPTQDDVQKAVKTTNLPGTRILVVTAEATDPERAKDLANAATRAFVDYKRSLAMRDMMGNEGNLERQVAHAGLAMDQAERRERESRQASPQSDSASRLKENMEIATELYRRLKTALDATHLQRDLVSGDVTIIQYADSPTVPSS